MFEEVSGKFLPAIRVLQLELGAGGTRRKAGEVEGIPVEDGVRQCAGFFEKMRARAGERALTAAGGNKGNDPV